MTTEGSTTGILLGDKTYDRAKFLVQIILPALAVLYASLSEFWGFPKVQEVVGTIGALALFLGLVLRISSNNFEPPPVMGTPVGQFNVIELPDGRKTVNLELDRDPESVINDEVISFKLKTHPAEVVPEVPVVDDREENPS